MNLTPITPPAPGTNRYQEEPWFREVQAKTPHNIESLQRNIEKMRNNESGKNELVKQYPYKNAIPMSKNPSRQTRLVKNGIFQTPMSMNVPLQTPTTTGNRSADSTHSSKKSGNPPRYYCKCGRSYKYSRGLCQHRKYECGKAPLIDCPHCPYKTKFAHNLKSHIALKHINREASHEGEDLYSSAKE